MGRYLLALLGAILILSGACRAAERPGPTATSSAAPAAAPSADLGWLATVRGGDIWTQRLPHGEAQRLTADGRNSGPRWSPSGEWLAFHKDTELWVARSDGTEAHVLTACGPLNVVAWVPSGDRLACVAGSGVLRLETIHADGTGRITLIPPAEGASGTLGRIAWSPDGRWVAFEWREGSSYQGLWKISADGQERSELYASGLPEKGEAILAGWSPDSQHVLFWQGDVLSASMLADGVPLYSLPVDGGQPLKLVDTVLVHDDFLAPAPQAGRLAVAAGGYRATWTNKRIAVVGLDGGELAWMTDEGVAACSPTWSPDGARLAYVAMPDRGDLVGGEDARLGMMARSIWVIGADGLGPVALTEGSTYRDERPLWSADGSHILFVRMEAGGAASLWLIPAAGGEPRQVAEDVSPLPGPAEGWFGYYGHVAWDGLFDWWGD